MEQLRLVVTPTPCCCAHLLLCDLLGWRVDAELLQWVDDLATGANEDRAVEDEVQMVDAGILSAEQEDTVSVCIERGPGGSGGKALTSSGEQG